MISNPEIILWRIALWGFSLMLHLAQDSVCDLANQITVLERRSCFFDINLLQYLAKLNFVIKHVPGERLSCMSPEECAFL